jgi:pilus assembly protein FimV
VQLNRSLLRFFLPLIFLPLSGVAAAIGLGELRGQPALGERPRLEIDILGAGKESLDASCFRLVQPVGATDLPWLKKASFSIRKAMPPVLEIRSETPLSEPILQLAVQMSCGIEVVRQYVLLASPIQDRATSLLTLPLVPEIQRAPIENVPRAARVRSESPEHLAAEPRRLPTKRADKRPAPSSLPDRLTLSGAMDVGEPSLRVATELLSVVGGNTVVKEAQREILRLEFRMLAALHEQVTTQMATAEKLRNMEGTLGELQQRTSEFAQRVEQPSTPVVAPVQNVEPPVAQPAPQVSAIPERKPAAVVPPVPSAEASGGLSEWSLYGALIGVFLGLAGWLGWKKYRERQQSPAIDEDLIEFPELEIDPKRDEEHEDSDGIDLRVEPSAMGLPIQVDVELDGGEHSQAQDVGHPVIAPSPHDSLMSIGAATLDEHFEANPVMELADIMLSFGRVKGAAQALQEYIDNSPQEALQPWIRLMDVYRMAGMKSEFETVAANLNKNFNVEIQQWDGEQLRSADTTIDLVLDDVESPPVAPRPESLEDMPRIVSMVCELWPTGDVVGYLYQLLRDNRGGKRLGFALPVVEEILFLVELKETSNRIQ